MLTGSVDNILSSSMEGYEKKEHLMLTLLILGEKQPGNVIDGLLTTFSR